MKQTLIALSFVLMAAITKAQFALAICKPNYSPLDEHFYAIKDSYKSVEKVKEMALDNCREGRNGEKAFIYYEDETSKDTYYAICKGKSQYGGFAVYSVGKGDTKEDAVSNAKDDNRGFDKTIIKVFVPWLNGAASD